MARNKLTDLNNHLFAQLERLGDEDLKGEDLKNEVQRARAITDVASKVVDNARVSLEAARYLTLEGNKESLPEYIALDYKEVKD